MHSPEWGVRKSVSAPLVSLDVFYFFLFKKYYFISFTNFQFFFLFSFFFLGHHQFVCWLFLQHFLWDLFLFFFPCSRKKEKKKGVESLLFVLLLQEKIKTKVYKSLFFPMGLYFLIFLLRKREIFLWTP